MGLGAREVAAQPSSWESDIRKRPTSKWKFLKVFCDMPIMTKIRVYKQCVRTHRYVTVIHYKHFLEHTAVSKELL